VSPNWRSFSSIGVRSRMAKRVAATGSSCSNFDCTLSFFPSSASFASTLRMRRSSTMLSASKISVRSSFSVRSFPFS